MASPLIQSLRTSIERSPIATCVTDPQQADNPVVAVNESFCVLTGYARPEIIGRNCRFLAGPGTELQPREALRTAVMKGHPEVVELTNYRRDGSAFRNAVMVAPILAEDGSIRYFYGSQMDVGSAHVDREAATATILTSLTARQRQVLELMSIGYRNKQIGFALGISEKTVKMHRALLLKSLKVPTSADAIRIAVEAGLGFTDRDR